jgi:hypothetical protein
MNLIACPNCGVVYDANILKFPDDIHHSDGSINTELAVWDKGGYVAKVDCRICQAPIPKF